MTIRYPYDGAGVTIISDGTTTTFSVDLNLPPWNKDWKGNFPTGLLGSPVVTVYSEAPGVGGVQDTSFSATATLSRYLLTITLNKPIPLSTPSLFWSGSVQINFVGDTF